MKKVLFMPFLQIPSGHHQVADALMDGIKSIDQEIHCEKVDILHYGYGKIERLVSGTYLKWISYFPQFYSWLYRKSVCDKMKKNKRFRHYELLFLSVMQDIVKEKNPDLIVCTHALPSYMLSQLKLKGLITTPVINVYTDFFINHLWGVNEINHHFVPSKLMKEYLVLKGIEKSKIHVTGIPIHQKFINKSDKKVIQSEFNSLNLLVTGGNLGVGLIEKLVEKLGNQNIHYSVLCGKNVSLYKRLSNMNRANLEAIPFVESREEMDRLYNRCNGIITKPGGVTVSESLHKRLPIFVYHTLPGQEEMNLKQLQSMGLANHLSTWEENDYFEDEIVSFFENSQAIGDYHDRLDRYHEQIEHDNPAEIILSK